MSARPNGWGAGSGATAGQLRAVYTAMRILAEDDREHGRDAGTVLCDACQRERTAAGSVVYGAVRLCNGCATDYEVLRVSRQVEDVAAYLAGRAANAPAPR